MKRLILLGGGHAHVQVLADLAASPIPGWAVTLISPYPRQVYSGMLPGWVAGHYGLDECTIPLDRLAARAGIERLETRAIGLDASRQLLRLADGSALPFDRLSIDTGSAAATFGLNGSTQDALPIRPIESFVAAWPALMARIRACSGRFEMVVVGAGAAGVELALAIRHRADREGWPSLRLSVVGASHEPLPGLPRRAQQVAMAWLKRQGIQWVGGQRAEHCETNRVWLQGGQVLPADATLLVLGAAAPEWLRGSGLSTDLRGFIRVTPGLQSVSHPCITAAGDVAAYTSERPKSGVFAVRAGGPLSRNLRALCQSQAPLAWKPQTRALYLLSGGGQRAIACWGALSFHGNWAWRWKDRIDRRFIARFAVSGPQIQSREVSP